MQVLHTVLYAAHVKGKTRLHFCVLIHLYSTGRYVPDLADLIQNKNKDSSVHINLRGILVMSVKLCLLKQLLVY